MKSSGLAMKRFIVLPVLKKNTDAQNNKNRRRTVHHLQAFLRHLSTNAIQDVFKFQFYYTLWHMNQYTGVSDENRIRLLCEVSFRICFPHFFSWHKLYILSKMTNLSVLPKLWKTNIVSLFSYGVTFNLCLAVKLYNT